jgi:hypothetical protein
MSMTFVAEHDSNHDIYQAFKADGVTPLVGGQFIMPKQGTRIRGRKALSYVHNSGCSLFDTTNPRFIPHEKPGYDVNNPNAGWVSYSSTRRGGFRPYNMRKARE